MDPLVHVHREGEVDLGASEVAWVVYMDIDYILIFDWIDRLILKETCCLKLFRVKDGTK